MKKILMFLFFSVIFIGCNSQKVSIDYDRNFNFNQVKTYRLQDISGTSLNQFDQIRLADALEKNFKFRGVRKVTDNPDVEITVSPREFVSSSTASTVGFGIGTGILRRVGGGISVGIPVRTQNLNQEYVVSMVQNNSLIWEGILTIKLPVNASQETKQQGIDNGVSKLLANYPPKLK